VDCSYDRFLYFVCLYVCNVGRGFDRGDGRDIFSKVKAPTLVVHGQDDLAVSPDEGRLIASTVPDAHLVLLPTGTHYFPTDRDVVNKVVGAINRFVKG
jgi:pimeloyl-ACP methyl ester carboxylesterase